MGSIDDVWPAGPLCVVEAQVFAGGVHRGMQREEVAKFL